MSTQSEGAGQKPLRCLVVYFASQLVFGMICGMLGPTIPWLATRAGVDPASLGLLPAAQCVTCICSGLASMGLVARIPRARQHRVLCCLQLWLGGCFALLPAASRSLAALTCIYGLQVLPRPWIGQMTNLLVSQLYEDTARSNAVQSFSQGGFALGCIAAQLLNYAAAKMSSSAGAAASFFCAAVVSAGAALAFLALPPPRELPSSAPAQASGRRPAGLSSRFVILCAGVAALAIGLEVACGTWLVTCLLETGFSRSSATLMSSVFWALFAASRLVLTPLLCRTLDPSSMSILVGGSSLAVVSSIVGAAWHTSVAAVMTAVGGIAVGAGPSYAMTISLAKQRVGLSSTDSALFSVAASVGAGGVPFMVSRVLLAAGPSALFLALLGVSAAMLLGATALSVAAPRAGQQRCKLQEGDMAKDPEAARGSPQVPTQQGIVGAAAAGGGSAEQVQVVAQRPKIWIMWGQGWEAAPLICRLCAASWQANNPDFDVVKLDDDNVGSWLPELLDKSSFAWKTIPRKRSNYIRLKLLAEHGGVWADSTSLSTGSLSAFLRRHPRADELFVFDRRASCEWPMHDPFVNEGLQFSNWFFVSLKPGHPVMVQAAEKYKQAVMKEIVEGDGIYFTMHQRIQSSEVWVAAQKEMPSVSAGLPHLVEFGLDFLAPLAGPGRSLLEEALAAVPLQKLSHKVLKDDLLKSLLAAGLLERTVIGHLLLQAFGDSAGEVLRREGLAAQLEVGETADAESLLRPLRGEELAQKRATYLAWPGLQRPAGGFGLKEESSSGSETASTCDAEAEEESSRGSETESTCDTAAESA